MNNLFAHIVRNDKIYFVSSIIALILICSQIRNVGFDSGFASLGIQDDKYLEARKKVDDIFHRNKRIIVEVIPEEGNFLQVQADMRLWEEQLSLEYDTILFKSWIKAVSLLYSNKQLRELPKETIFNRFADIELFQNLVGENRKSFLVVLEIPYGETKRVIEKYNRALENTDFELIYTFHVSSSFHLEKAVNDSVLKDIKLIIAALLLFFVIIMLWAYRRLYAMLYLVFNVFIAMLVALAVHSFVGQPLNLITILVLPVVIVLASADAIHLLTGFYGQKEGLTSKEKVQNVYFKYGIPSLLTSLTTSVAFFSLMFNNTKSVFTLGWITGVTVLIIFVLCFCMSPWLFRFAKPQNIEKHPFNNIANFFIDRKKFFTFLLIPMLIIAIVLLPKLTYKNNFEMFIPVNSEAKIQHDLIRDNYSSEATMDVLIELPDSSGRSDLVRDLGIEIGKQEYVDAVKNAQTKSIVLSKFMIPIDLAVISGYANRFSAEDGKLQRIQIGVKQPDRMIDIEQSVVTLLKNRGLDDYIISSSVLAYHNVNKEVGKSLFQSLLSSSLFLFILFLILTRSFPLSLIGLFANLVPLSLIVIIFIGFDLHINIMTAMTAVVCLGIIVDDTIHSFYRRVVLKEQLRELSFGMLTTTLILTIGFGVFTLSDVKPVAIFGAVAASVFVVTLISDFTLLLYFIDLYDRYKRKNGIGDGTD